MNCTINTFSPCPTQRKAVPRAAVVFPLPGPVLTIINPLRVSGDRASFISLECGSSLPLSPVPRLLPLGGTNILAVHSREQARRTKAAASCRTPELARVRVSPQDSESPVDLLQQKRPRPIVRQRHS